MSEPIPVKVEQPTVLPVRETHPLPPVGIVPQWSYWVPVVTAIVAAAQVIIMGYFAVQTERIKHEVIGAQKETTEAVNVLEKQINSNLEKQFADFRAMVLAQERERRAKEGAGAK